MGPPTTHKQLKNSWESVLCSKIHSNIDQAPRVIPQVVQEECTILVRQGAIENLPKSQGRTKFIFDHDSTYEGFASHSLFHFTNKLICALLA